MTASYRQRRQSTYKSKRYKNDESRSTQHRQQSKKEGIVAEVEQIKKVRERLQQDVGCFVAASNGRQLKCYPCSKAINTFDIYSIKKHLQSKRYLDKLISIKLQRMSNTKTLAQLRVNSDCPPTEQD